MKTPHIKIAALQVLALSPGTVTAAVKNWIAGSGNWNVAGNWSPAGVPGAGDDVGNKRVRTILPWNSFTIRYLRAWNNWRSFTH